MKKVLIITYYWPPMGGGGVQRWLKTVKYLRSYGWEPVIFTTKNGESSVVDEGIISQVPEGIETLKVPIWEPFGLYKKITGKKKNEKLSPGTVSDKNKTFLDIFSIWVRGNLFIPDARKFWIKPSSKFLNKYLQSNKIDAIISTGPPHTTHMIALDLKRKFSIPWLSDFRDPWTNIDFYHKLKLTDWADKRHRRLEQEVLTNANQVVTVSWSWAEDFRKISGRMPVVITNGYDPDDFGQAEMVDLDKKFTITHAGSLNDDRNPHVLWRALADLNRYLEGFQSDLEIKLIGQISPFAIQELIEYGLENNFIRIDTLPHHRVLTELIKSQTLLLPLNNTPNIDGVVPGKLYEYIGAKRPIICIGKPDGDAAKIINETNSGLVSDFEDLSGIKKIISSYYKDYKNGSLRINSKGYEKYSRKLLAGQIAEELNKISN